MLPTALHDIVPTLTDEQLNELADLALNLEPRRRRDEEAMARAIAKLREAGELPAPKAAVIDPENEDPNDAPEWVDPEGKLSAMYTMGSVVKRHGLYYESSYQGLNQWEPGAEGVSEQVWRDVTRFWVAPEGVGWWEQDRDLKAGDLVYFNGMTYRVLQDHTSRMRAMPHRAPKLYEPVTEDNPSE